MLPCCVVHNKKHLFNETVHMILILVIIMGFKGVIEKYMRLELIIIWVNNIEKFLRIFPGTLVVV